MKLSMQKSFDINKAAAGGDEGFTLIEVIIAAGLMIILSVGTLTVFTHAVRINRGNNLRSQAQTVLQQEVEYYRGLKFVPGLETVADLNNHRHTDIRVGSRTRPQRTSSDGRVFNIDVTVTNLASGPAGTDEHVCRYKEITITATPAVAETGWLANLNTNVTIQRVRIN